MTQKAVSLEPSAVSSAAHRLSRLLLTFQILPLPLHREAPEQGGCVCVLKAVDGLVDLQGTVLILPLVLLGLFLVRLQASDSKALGTRVLRRPEAREGSGLWVSR